MGFSWGGLEPQDRTVLYFYGVHRFLNEPTLGDSLYFYETDYLPYRTFSLNEDAFYIRNSRDVLYYADYDALTLESLDIPTQFQSNCAEGLPDIPLITNSQETEASISELTAPGGTEVTTGEPQAVTSESENTDNSNGGASTSIFSVLALCLVLSLRTRRGL